MRVTIDLDSQTGQPSGPGAINLSAQNGGAARYALPASGRAAPSMAATDAGAAPTQIKD
jgi:hypothetical protein